MYSRFMVNLSVSERNGGRSGCKILVASDSMVVLVTTVVLSPWIFLSSLLLLVVVVVVVVYVGKALLRVGGALNPTGASLRTRTVDASVPFVAGTDTSRDASSPPPPPPPGA